APSRLTTTDMRCLLDHARTRYNTLAWGGSPTGRFCPVHDWPVFRCPPRAASMLAKYTPSRLTTRCPAATALKVVRKPSRASSSDFTRIVSVLVIDPPP